MCFLRADNIYEICRMECQSFVSSSCLKFVTPPKTVHTQVVVMTYLCTTVHTSYLQPLITFLSNRKKNRLHAVSNIRNSIRLVDRQPKKHICCGDAWTSLTIQALCGQGSIAAPRLTQIRRDKFIQV